MQSAVQQCIYIALYGKNGCLQFMAQVLQKFFSENFILSEGIYFCLALFCPCLYIFPYFINAFLRQYIFIIKFFTLGSFCLVNEFIDQFYFPVNECLQGKENKAVAAAENNYKREWRNPPNGFKNKNAETDRQ